jgi:hypothetical protein
MVVSNYQMMKCIGAAQGFKLSILLKLVQVKAADNSMTLLNYLALILREKDPALLDFLDALPTIQEASRVTLQVLHVGLDAIQKAAKTVEKELDLHGQLSLLDKNDRFQAAIAPVRAQMYSIQIEMVSTVITWLDMHAPWDGGVTFRTMTME